MTIFIAGGAGYIGSHTNKILGKKGYETVVFDNLLYGHREFAKWGDFILGDLANREQIRLCFQKYKFDAVMHFSAFTYVNESVMDPAKYYRNNVANTLNLMETMREFKVNKFIFSSTCATYGLPQEIPMDENHPQNPINPYGQSKLMIEKILRDFQIAYGMQYMNLRYFNAAGADPEGEIGEWHEPETHLIPLTMYAALGLREDIKIFGTNYPTPDGTCLRDYIHVLDLADAHIKGLDYLEKTNHSDSFNLGTNRSYSVREVIDRVKEKTGRSFKVVETQRREGDPPALVSSSKKAKDVLHWDPRYSDLDTIIETAWAWHKKRVQTK